MYAPLVSIIIPTYNYGHFIVEALLSVSEQSYQQWECIIVDDGSTDNTAAIVDAYIKMRPHQQFRYVYIKNAGLSNARNVGIQNSKGRYIQFLDADDLLLKEKLSVQVKRLQTEHCALVFSKSFFFNEQDSKKVYKDKYPIGFLANETLKGQQLILSLIKNNIFTVSSALVHKELMVQAGLFDVMSNNNEDWLMWFKVALLRPIFIFDDTIDTGTEIRNHQQGIMSGKEKMFQGEIFVRNQIDLLLMNQDNTEEISISRRYNQDLLALHNIRSVSLSDGMSYVLKTFVKSPRRNFRLLVTAAKKVMIRIVKND